MAVIIIIHSGGLQVKKQLTRTPLLMGRSSSCSVKLTDSMVSGKHISIQIGTNGVALFKDLDTTNGTYLNGSNVVESYLYVGDEISIGEIHIEIDPSQLTSREEELHTRPIERTQHTFISLPVDEETAVRKAMKIVKKSSTEIALANKRQQEIINMLKKEEESGDEYVSSEGTESKPGLKTRVINNANKLVRKESSVIDEVRDGKNFDLEESSGETKLLKITKKTTKKKSKL